MSLGQIIFVVVCFYIGWLVATVSLFHSERKWIVEPQIYDRAKQLGKGDVGAMERIIGDAKKRNPWYIVAQAMLILWPIPWAVGILWRLGVFWNDLGGFHG